MNRIIQLAFVILWLAGGFACMPERSYDLSRYGVSPDGQTDNAQALAKALAEIREGAREGQPILISLPKGRYDFYPDHAAERTYFISNHDQDNPKKVGLPFEGMRDMVFDGNGSELVFHGRMLPVSLLNSENCTLRNFSIDFEDPQITQIEILENDTLEGGITFEVAPWADYEIRKGEFTAKGHGWKLVPRSGIAFEKESHHLAYQTSDLPVVMKGVEEISPHVIHSPDWKDPRLKVGTIVALRTWKRPAPGIFLYKNNRTTIENVHVHYAEGMGLLAQTCEDITLDGFCVCLGGEDDPRYFTTQADATHFSGCKGKIISRNGLYEGMMDDAINVHGTYLGVMGRVNDTTLIARYMHPQTFGFEWGQQGDSVQFIRAATMETVGEVNRIVSIVPYGQTDIEGAKEFRIVLENILPPDVEAFESFGIENLTWTPEVTFSNNTIRNNRARGALFSTPRKTVIEENVFDHTSGTAILLCGDCNGWFETGACKDVTIRHNTFIHSLTNLFQFTNAIISIYPEIPHLEAQTKYFHGGIVIDSNEFITFDRPLVYAKSVDGLSFTNNVIQHEAAYPAFHWNQHPFLFERVIHTHIDNNLFDEPFDPETDIQTQP